MEQREFPKGIGFKNGIFLDEMLVMLEREPNLGRVEVRLYEELRKREFEVTYDRGSTPVVIRGLSDFTKDIDSFSMEKLIDMHGGHLWHINAWAEASDVKMSLRDYKVPLLSNNRVRVHVLVLYFDLSFLTITEHMYFVTALHGRASRRGPPLPLRYRSAS